MNSPEKPTIYRHLDPCISCKGDLRAQWSNLKLYNMPMVWLLRAICQDKQKPIVITSIWRNDPTSVHSWYRGVDLRVYNELRNVDVTGVKSVSGQTEEWWRDSLEELSKSFSYDSKHKIYKIHGEGLDRHVHLQTKGTGPWHNE